MPHMNQGPETPDWSGQTARLREPFSLCRLNTASLPPASALSCLRSVRACIQLTASTVTAPMNRTSRAGSHRRIHGGRMKRAQPPHRGQRASASSSVAKAEADGCAVPTTMPRMLREKFSRSTVQVSVHQHRRLGDEQER